MKDVCDHLIRIIIVTGRDFSEMANVLLPSIIGTSKSMLAAIRHPGEKLLSKLSENVRYDLAIVRKVYENAVQGRAVFKHIVESRCCYIFFDVLMFFCRF